MQHNYKWRLFVPYYQAEPMAIWFFDYCSYSFKTEQDLFLFLGISRLSAFVFLLWIIRSIPTQFPAKYP